MSLEPSGIVTLLTDFGVRDVFVGMMKGQVLSRCPTARLVDLTHSIRPYWPMEAGFLLSRAYRYFPQGTVHVAVVDPGVGTARRLLAVAADRHVFLGPDNGLLGGLAHQPGAETRAIDLGVLEWLGLPQASATFHGRDILGPLAGEWVHRRVVFEEFGNVVEDAAPDLVPLPAVHRDRTDGVIVTIDHYGNCFSNLDGSSRNRFNSPCLLAAGRQLPLRRTYGEAQPGELIAVLNSFGVLEVAQVEGNAAAALGLRPGDSVSLAEQSTQRTS